MFRLYQGPTLEGVPVSYCHNDVARQTTEILPLSVPGHRGKGDIAIKQAVRIFWFPSICKSYVYTLLSLLSVH